MAITYLDDADSTNDQHATDHHRVRLAQLQAQIVRKIPWCPWEPTEKQASFLLDFSQEVLFGGAVGGAKSVALLMAASLFIEVPEYAALLIRKSFADLSQPRALMDLAEQWWRGNNWEGKGTPRYDPATHTWTFPSGATITFGYIDRVNDHLKYQGAAYQFVGFDEVTQHRENHYRYLFSRMRRSSDGPIAQVPIRMRATANPGGPGHDWVYKRFIHPHELFLSRGVRPPRRFIPSFLDDNPHLDREEYLKSLEELDPVTRAQLLRGDWNIRPDGRMFKRGWFKYVDDSPIYHSWPRVRYWDMAATDETPGGDPDYTVGAKMAMNPGTGQLVLLDIVRTRANPAKVEELMKKTAQKDGREVPQYIEQEPGSAGKTVIHHIRTKVLQGWSVYGNLPSGSKIVRAAPFASRADAGDVSVVKGEWNEAWIDEVELFPDAFHDDQVDATAGSYQVLAKRPHVVFPTGMNDDLMQENPWDMN